MTEIISNQNGGVNASPSQTIETIGNKVIIVSMFESIKANIPLGDVDLFKYLTNSSHKVNIENLRRLSDENDRKRFKGTLTCITASGTFSIRKLDGLIKHSGIICIDIDGKDNLHIENFSWLRDELGKIVNVAYSSLSASGNGVFCLIPIRNPKKHKEHFNALQQDFLKLGIVIDKSCNDVSRLRISSYDENAYINLNAIVYTEELDLNTVKIKRAPLQKSPANPKRANGRLSTRDRVIEIITEVENKSYDMTGDYTQWFQLGCALANEFGEEGRDFFHRISKFGDSYNEMITDTQFSKCTESSYSYSIGTFIHCAEKYNLT